MMRFALLWLTCLLAYHSSAQYVDGVTTPDLSKSIVKDAQYEWSQTITARDLSEHLYTLASDEFGGRELGTEGNQKAALYIADQFSALGLQPLTGANDYFQEVDFTWIYWEDISMMINGNRYKQLWDFVAFQDANRGKNINTDEVTYLGYGIEDDRYSDYKKAKVKDKVILIYEGEPKDKKGRYRITKSDKASDWSSDLNLKLEAAKRHGVQHVLIISDNIKKMVEDNRRQLLGAKVILGKPTATEAPVDYTYISSTMAKEILGKETDKVIKRQKCITKRGKSKPVEAKVDLEMQQEKSVRHVSGVNVAAMLPGKSKADEYVFLTAHYDHIGKKGRDINNGADDNASGTSTVLEIAEAYALAAEKGERPDRSIVFMLVTGEEKGLLGSDYYVENPIIPLEQTMVDINIDMVGRLHKDYLETPEYIYVIGSDRLSTDLHKVNEKVNEKYSKLILDYRYNSEQDPNRFYYRSDHYNFAKKGIPAIFFFNGTHEDYHRPSDTADKIEYDKMAKIGQHIFNLSWTLGDLEERIVVDGE